ncbi:T6SS effector amidase Tae4 family protein [Pedobacter sp. Leaf41]|uniref:T6SS effector amidase Tae4 family protein n=1 Tax=Pedobacter sp. Leaf41 TaxID=1736218 RepID=UPI0012FCE0DB|nr:T6SS effector amidase Tae4 family protein [Pedobacter sp. Leaf41]
MGITDVDKQNFLLTHNEIYLALSDYLVTNGTTTETKEFVDWAVWYLMENPTVSLETFKNRFFYKTADGSDGLNDFDISYWNDPNLIIAHKVLTSYTDFYLAYPKNSTGFELDAASVFNLVGGTPKTLRDASLNDNNSDNDNTYSNACALRVSRALNYSGVAIPEVSGTYKGGDGKNYFLSAASLYAWMTKAFPPTPFNSIILNGSDSGPHGAGFANAMAGSKGIYIMLPNYPGFAYFGASGHAGIHTYPEMTHYYFDAKGGVNKITLWKLY